MEGWMPILVIFALGFSLYALNEAINREQELAIEACHPMTALFDARGEVVCVNAELPVTRHD